MNSLVGYGVSSDSEDEEDGGGGDELAEKKDVNDDGEEKARNFLLESGSASSEPSSESEREEERENASDPSAANMHSSPQLHLRHPSFSAASRKLPPPPLGPLGKGAVPAGSSVFANPFKQRAEERLNVLQKHVPLTLQARPTQIGGKRMCVAYRKDGRCRFGSSCKFAHDSDLQSTAGVPREPVVSESNPGAQVDSGGAGSRTSVEETEDEESRKRKKRRVGLSPGLVPPKRALKQYAMHRHGSSHS